MGMRRHPLGGAPRPLRHSVFSQMKVWMATAASLSRPVKLILDGNGRSNSRSCRGSSRICLECFSDVDYEALRRTQGAPGSSHKNRMGLLFE
jgi:hypothetical protein